MTFLFHSFRKQMIQVYRHAILREVRKGVVVKCERTSRVAKLTNAVLEL